MNILNIVILIIDFITLNVMWLFNLLSTDYAMNFSMSIYT